MYSIKIMTKLFAFTIPAAIITAAASSVIYAGSGKKNRTQSQMVRVRTLFAAFAFLICFAFAAQNSSAATLVVDNTGDVSTMNACTAAANDCSLRGAIGKAVSGDMITFDPTIFASAQTITLGSPLFISKSLTITGTGADKLTIMKSSAPMNRVFQISGNGVTVNLSGMKITGGNLRSSAVVGGGGILNIATLNITGCWITGNSSTNSSLSGGGIANFGTMTITNSTVSNNTAQGGSGVLTSNRGSLTIINSTISGNLAPSGGEGAAFLLTVIQQSRAAQSPIIRLAPAAGFSVTLGRSRSATPSSRRTSITQPFLMLAEHSLRRVTI